MRHGVFRESLLRLVTVLGTVLFASTELLGAFERIQRHSLTIVWIGVAGCGFAAIALRRRHFRFRAQALRPDPVVLLCAAACFIIVAITAATAIVSPPNSADAMAYHMPRVVYWAEQSSVRFFPTPYLAQIMLQPFAEYAMLHLYVLSGGDYLVNLVQWFASVIGIVAVSLAAGLFGATRRGQAIAALVCATLPSGILASSGAKNDCVLAMWMAIAVCFAIRFASTSRMSDALFLGAAIGLALQTKATAYLFLPWLIGAVLIARWRPVSQRAAATAAAATACALAINAPQFIRNYALSGSIMGFDSAQANGFFRWRNETFGWKQTVSNAVRNTSEQLGARNERWNRAVYDTAIFIHRRMGSDPNDAATTWRWTKFAPPENANHEANAPNRWHLILLLATAGMFAWRALRGRDRERALYVAALLCGFLASCAYLKWQPFLGRLFLPLFIAAAPMAGIAGELRPAIAVLLCLFLIDNARLPLLQNWVRPLTGPASILHVPRDEQYFADMLPWKNRHSYEASADYIVRTGCDTVGIDINNLQLEYPLMALVRERRPSTRFMHTAVMNPSRSYRWPIETPPCVIACLDCFGDTPRLSLYKEFAKAAVFGKFVVLSKEEYLRSEVSAGPTRPSPPFRLSRGSPDGHAARYRVRASPR
ncbi:MAG: glycosyltransferase family 39 protein [Acidobacteriota bacterium]|nr:glycosyltransferase family 39 protein [Acidobacteriota bacterium]